MSIHLYSKEGSVFVRDNVFDVRKVNDFLWLKFFDGGSEDICLASHYAYEVI